ncbi:hypothetical protein MGYG_01196 [Nannizzia gypsea CBS 118893]|uniref:Uncharacterized protein n=1 Tax=Arthroderma gypseum (strain ATCC MYA-4604 / CBS 118893) TaxID=535722 RepID=E5QZE2_ARTGP|nr:hypothetical protein MGYG_01196 [Nannizzia gypsea CBS 118893]EFQ98160.1 hypothetical protein MGYG_01196 [Nannizzia gypsea CBS 118893]
MWKKIHKPRDWAKPQGQAVTVSASDKIHGMSGFGHGGYTHPHEPQISQAKMIVSEPLPKPSFQSAHARNTSSVYSQDSTAHSPHNHGEPYHSYSSAYHSGYGDRDLSPPVSPIREQYPSSRESHNVSPIEEPGSNPIPDMDNKEKRSAHRAAYASNSNGDIKAPAARRQYSTKWDDYPGELTTSDKGRYPQGTPGNTKLEGCSMASGPSKPRFDIETKAGHMNVPKTRRRMDPDTSAYGNPPPPPLKDGGYRGRSSTQPVGGKPITNPKARDDKALPMAPKPRPAVPEKDKVLARPAPTPLTIPNSTHLSLFEDVLQTTSTSTWETSKFGGAVEQAEQASSKGDNGLSDLLTQQLQGIAFPREPCSRFSATTYATTEPGSPPPISESFEQPLPGIGSKMHQFSAKNTIRKPTPSQMTTVSEVGTVAQTQPETNITTRIEDLKSKLADLARRKTNIDTMIHELTQVIQPSSIAYDMATRSEVNKTVTSLNNELADIKKEEHELGLKLLRAYKKRDKGDIYANEPTLWVKRVTS